MNIALEIGDRSMESGAYGCLAAAYGHLGQLDKAVEFQQREVEVVVVHV